MIKIYPKRFEDVFQVPERRGFGMYTNGAKNKDGTPYTKLFKREHPLSSWKNITFQNLVREEGMGRFRSVLLEWDAFFFDQIVKLAWMDASLLYKGRHIVERTLTRSFPDFFSKEEMGDNGNRGTFSVELERELGRSFLPVKQTGVFLRALSSYVFHFFPREFFLDHDPFVDSKYFVYPFKHVHSEFLVFVYDMEERFELLQMAEEQKWSLAYFMDWVINYAYSFNLEYGKDVYVLQRNNLDRNSWCITDTRRVSRVNVSKEQLEKNFKEYTRMKKEEKKRLGDFVKFKTFAECFPQYVKKS